MASNPKTGEPSWFYRRTMAFAIVGVCLFNLTRITDSVLAEVSAWLAFGVFLLYGGYSTVQDLLAIWVAKSGRPYAEPAPGVTVETETVKTKTTATPDPAASPAADPNAPPPGFAQ